MSGGAGRRGWSQVEGPLTGGERLKTLQGCEVPPRWVPASSPAHLPSPSSASHPLCSATCSLAFFQVLQPGSSVSLFPLPGTCAEIHGAQSFTSSVSAVPSLFQRSFLTPPCLPWVLASSCYQGPCYHKHHALVLLGFPSTVQPCIMHFARIYSLSVPS